MITYSTGNLFSDFDNGVTNAIVIPVNCVGVMGKGVALEAKNRIEGCEMEYNWLNSSSKFEAGNLYILGGRSEIWFVTTKDHYRNPSKIEWVESIVKKLSKIENAANLGFFNVGVPALGCGLGGLLWNDVKALYEKYLTESPINFICYLPQ